jgi:REP-associated tyrosine transposase
LGRLIGAFKTVSTKNINLLRDAKESIVWQRNYYEHVIRNDKDLQNKTNYVEANPILWNEDDENPLNIKL